MACLSVSDQSWVSSLPKMRASLGRQQPTDDADDDTQTQTQIDHKFVYRLDKVFPVYALGIPSSNSDSDSDSLVSLADPIWDAVREEAKSVVIRIFIVFLFFFL